MNGIELVRRLHESGGYTPVIIFVSGFVDLPLPDAYDLGVEAVLTKPCHRQELVGALRRSIRRRDLIFEPSEGIAAPENGTDRIHHRPEKGLENSPVAVGRGGVSLDTEQQLDPGSSVAFSLDLAGAREDLPTPLCGWGVVRWCGMVSEHVRAGIEFMYLDQESREAFAHWLQREHLSSFIPKMHYARSSRASP